jgi:hypothetical protein
MTDSDFPRDEAVNHSAVWSSTNAEVLFDVAKNAALDRKPISPPKRGER